MHQLYLSNSSKKQSSTIALFPCVSSMYDAIAGCLHERQSATATAATNSAWPTLFRCQPAFRRLSFRGAYRHRPDMRCDLYLFERTADAMLFPSWLVVHESVLDSEI